MRSRAMQVKTYDEAPEVTAGGHLVKNYFGAVNTKGNSAQAYLVKLRDADSRVIPHFHDVDQFQVVIEGSGRFGKKEMRPVAFHYADAYTPYGPISPDAKGLWYFTLRMTTSGGFFAMPGSRSIMMGKRGRSAVGTFTLGSVAVDPGACIWESLLQRTEDGIEAAGVRLGRNAAIDNRHASPHAQYWLVCSGSLIDGSRELPRLSLVLVPPDEPAPRLHGGSEGAEVLVLQFPRPTTRSSADPERPEGRTEYVMPTGGA
jgi:hypothetical protein